MCREEVNNLDDEEETRSLLRRRAASRPTAEEVRAHKATHLPFRDWCKECVAGRAKDWPVPEKGTNVEWIAQQIARDLKKCGIHGDVTLRSDQEPAITSTLDEVCKIRKDARTVPEVSPTGDSRANGIAERAVQSVEEMIRVHVTAVI